MGDDARVVSGDGPNGDNGAPGPLTDRELDVLRHLAEGKRNRDIAVALRISPRTVDVHVSHIFQKLAVGSRAGATGRAFRLGLVGLDDVV
jgi:DNA-binding NarL/FixJ family response regulator